jgi:hypothetical protein
MKAPCSDENRGRVFLFNHMSILMLIMANLVPTAFA